MTFLALLVAVAAAFRITRLIVVDTIFDRPRAALQGWLIARASRRGGWLALAVVDLIACQWCVGVHVAFWMTLAATLTGAWSPGGLVPFCIGWLGLAALQSILWTLVDALEAATYRMER